jgi:hypothetical protein
MTGLFEVRFQYQDGRKPSVRYVRLPPSPLVAFGVRRGDWVLQLQRFLVAELGHEQTGMLFGGTRDAYEQLYRSNKGQATIREVTEAPAGALVETLDAVSLPFQIQVPFSILQKHREDAVEVLRLGGISNALQTLLSRMLPSPGGTQRSRDTVHLTLIISSYVYEARFVLYGDAGRKTRFWELAAEGVRTGLQLPPNLVRRCEELLADTGPLGTRLRYVRHKVGFHLAPPVFRQWLKDQPPDEVCAILDVEDAVEQSPVFGAALDAISAECSQPDDEAFFAYATDLAQLLPFLIEAAVFGLLRLEGLDPARYRAIDPEGAITGRPRWKRREPAD